MRPRDVHDRIDCSGVTFSKELREWEFVGKKILVSGDLRKCVNSCKNDPVKRFYKVDA